MFLVFFFKQKTAYERRISDWSSDVCSSDLLAPVGHLGGALGLAVDRPGAGVVVRLAALRVAVDVGHDAEAEVRVLVKQAPRRLVVLAQVVLDEIGRAWCRERECQSVSISVGAV